jgi:hypothetical protein
MGGVEERYTPDGNWWWDGHKWVRVHREPDAEAGRGRSSRWLWLAAGAGVLLTGAGVAAVLALLDSDSPAGPASGAAATVAVVTHPATASEPPGVLVDTAGTGIGSTAEFDAPAHWKLRYTFDCSQIPAGMQGNLQVFIYQGDLPVDVPVNELGSRGGATIDVARPGRLHLEVNSECRWHVTVTS